MRVLLISANTETMNMRTLPFGMGCVAAATARAGHDVAMLDLLGEPDAAAAIARNVEEKKPQVIGVSVRNVDDQNSAGTKFMLVDVKKIVETCRVCSNAPIVLGGAGYSIFPRSALEYLGAEMGIQGEGEAAFPALLDRMERGDDLPEVPGLFIAGRDAVKERVFAPDLSGFPLPDDSFFSAVDSSDPALWMPVQARRGCAMDCSYCSTVIVEGRRVRSRSVQTMVDWLERAVGVGFEKFFLVDNNFNIPQSFAREVCREIADRGLSISWRCILNPLKVDENLVRAMAEAGCVEVSLGFESGAASILRQMNKKFCVEQIRACADLLGRHGIKRMGFLLLGGPGETVESAEESLAFADSLELEAMRLTVGLRIYPHTPLAETAVANGIIDEHDHLLFPRFYIVPGLERCLRDTLKRWKEKRPHWII